MDHRAYIYANANLIRPYTEKLGADVIKEAVVCEEKVVLTEMLDLINASANGKKIK